MATYPNLRIHEELVLLALRDREGTFVFGPPYQLAIGGAILAELLLAGRVAIEDDRRKRLAVLDRGSLGEPVLDECLQQIAESRRPRPAPTWVAQLANQPRVAHRIAEGLCRRGILRADEKKVLLLFSRTIYPEVDPEPERELIERLRTAILGSGQVEPRTATVIALADSCRLLDIPFERAKLKTRKKRIESIAVGAATSAATREALQAAQAAQAAVTAAITAATITTTIST